MLMLFSKLRMLNWRKFSTTTASFPATGQSPEETTKVENANEGETPLIAAIKENQFPQIKCWIQDSKVNINELGRFSWKGLDYLEAPPLFVAIMCDYSPLRNIVQLLTDRELATNNKSLAILDSISSSARLSRTEKIDVLELVGAAYILKKNFDLKSLKFALQYWRAAQSLRRDDDSGRPPIPNGPHNLSKCARKVFKNVNEFTTTEEMEAIFENHRLNQQPGLTMSDYPLQTQTHLKISESAKFILIRIRSFSIICSNTAIVGLCQKVGTDSVK